MVGLLCSETREIWQRMSILLTLNSSLLVRLKKYLLVRPTIRKLKCFAKFWFFLFCRKPKIALRKSEFGFDWPDTGTGRILGTILQY